VLGQSLLPSFLGMLAKNIGLEIVAPAMLMAAILLLALYEVLLSASPKLAPVETQAMV